MKNVLLVVAMFLTAFAASAGTLNGSSVLMEGRNAPNQLIVSGEPAKALYNQLAADPNQDRSAINKVMKKQANQMSCSYYVDSAEYSCNFEISVNGLVQSR